MAARRKDTPIVAVSGFSGAGKTRLVTRLLPALARRGLAVGLVKHTGHVHGFDVPGKDTAVAREAGAVFAAIAGPAGIAYFGPPVKGARALAALGPRVDLVLAEGWRSDPLPKVEVHRRSMNRPFLCAEDRRVFAVVTDEPPPRPLPTFDADDVEPLADLLCARFGLARPGRGRLPGGGAVRSLSASERPSALRGVRMAKTTTGRAGRRSRKAGAASRSKTARAKTAARGARRGRATRSDAGRKGGNATLRARGPEFYAEIGRKGGKKSGSRRRASTRAKARGGSRRSAAGRGRKRS
jgi:molybdopterin-guanine dinucleotide biosynthesis protein B